MKLFVFSLRFLSSVAFPATLVSRPVTTKVQNPILYGGGLKQAKITLSTSLVRVPFVSFKESFTQVSKAFSSPHCLKITQNVAFYFLFLAFSTNFCPIKTDLSGNTAYPKASGFPKLVKIVHFWHFQ